MFSVIFDMDGTLLDTQRICIPAWDFAGEKQGFKNLGDHIPNVCGMNQNGWTNYLKTNFPTLDIAPFIQNAREYIIKNGKPAFKKGAEELIGFLKQNNIKIALASGSSTESINHHLKAVGATDIFDAIIGGHDVQNGKPAPDIFLLAAEKLGVPPKTCFVLEDSVNGIKAGVAAGMKSIGIPDIVDFPEDIRKIMFAKAIDLSKVIEILKPFLD